MSSKNIESKRNSPKTSGKAKRTVQGQKNVLGHEGRATNSFDFGDAMRSTLTEGDIKRIVSIQRKSLKNFSKTNELLGKFNDFSSSKYDVLQHMFLQHTRLLLELKKDLTNVFSRIRRLKVKLLKEYPGAFEATFNLREDLEDRLEQEVPNGPTYNANADEHHAESKEKNEETTSEQGQDKSKNPGQKETSDEGSLVEDTKVSTLKATNSSKKNTVRGEGGSQPNGSMRDDEYVEASIEQRETVGDQEVNHGSESQEFSLESTGKQCVKVEVNDVDGEISSEKENLEVMKEYLNKNEDNLALAKDDLDKTKDCLEETLDNLEETEDNLEVTENDQEEMKGNLKDVRDNPEHTKDNRGTNENCEDIKDSLENTAGDLEETEDNLEETESKPGVKEGECKETKDDLVQTEDNSEVKEGDSQETGDSQEETKEPSED